MSNQHSFTLFLWAENDLQERRQTLRLAIEHQFPTLFYDDQHPEYVFCFGGDGTFLMAMKQYAHLEVKLIFINAGRLGFLANYATLADVVLDTKYEYYDVLKIRTGSQTYTAINEMTLYSPYTNQFSLLCNDQLFYTFRGSGCSITTMIGSTGLNRSNHGPLLMLRGLIFSETSPLNYRNDRGIGQDIIFDERCHLQLNTTNYQQKLQVQFDHEMLVPETDCFEIWLEPSNAQIVQALDLPHRMQKIQRTFF